MKSHRPSFLWIRVLLLVLLASGLAQSAAAQYCWVGAGSTGVLDPEDTSIAFLSGPHMQVNDTAPLPADVGARHSVTGIFEANGTSNTRKTMLVRYRDNGSQARVWVFLKQVNLATGAAADLVVFDSDQFSQSNDFQLVQATLPCVPGGAFHFFSYLYFLRVQLAKTGSGGLPSLHSIQVCGEGCTP